MTLTNGKVKGRRGVTSKKHPKRPTREEAHRAALEWASWVNSMLLMLGDTLQEVAADLRRSDCPFREFLNATDVEEVRRDLSSAWTSAASLWPRGLSPEPLPTPAALLTKKRGA